MHDASVASASTGCAAGSGSVPLGSRAASPALQEPASSSSPLAKYATATTIAKPAFAGLREEGWGFAIFHRQLPRRQRCHGEGLARKRGSVSRSSSATRSKAGCAAIWPNVPLASLAACRARKDSVSPFLPPRLRGFP
jgi:hypothetical protein